MAPGACICRLIRIERDVVVTVWYDMKPGIVVKEIVRDLGCSDEGHRGFPKWGIAWLKFVFHTRMLNSRGIGCGWHSGLKTCLCLKGLIEFYKEVYQCWWVEKRLRTIVIKLIMQKWIWEKGGPIYTHDIGVCVTWDGPYRANGNKKAWSQD